MVAPRKYPDELRERAVRMVLDAKQDPLTRVGACRRIGQQLGINPETLRGVPEVQLLGDRDEVPQLPRLAHVVGQADGTADR